MRFIDEALSQLPFRAEVIQTDNGSKFGSQFHWHLLDKEIRHVYIRPYRPRLNGEVERSQRIDEEESYRLLDGVAVDDTHLFDEKVREEKHFCNYSRPHAALNGQAPSGRFRKEVWALCVNDLFQSYILLTLRHSFSYTYHSKGITFSISLRGYESWRLYPGTRLNVESGTFS
jgi:hypothetical protein